MGTEKLVREADQPIKLTEEVLVRLIRERRCIILHILGAGGNMIRLRVRTDREPVLTEEGLILLDAWLPDCPDGAEEKLDRCIVNYHPESRQRLEADGKVFIEMGTIQLNLPADSVQADFPVRIRA